MNTVHLIDCMEFMKTVPDKYYELAIVDPPYGIGAEAGTGDYSKALFKNIKNWDSPPDEKYFNELFRISQNQIIWGGNYFVLPLSKTWLCWYKSDEIKGRDFSEFELAWTSFSSPARHFENKPFIRNKTRIHPTQKPVALYKWLLTNYAKPNDKIFDSHVGSGSSRIACYDLGFDFEGCELDLDYWQGQEDRYNLHISQQSLFDTSEIQELIYHD